MGAINPAWLNLAWSILIVLVVLLVGLGAFRAKVATKADVDAVGTTLAAKLYTKEGATIYMPRLECRESQSTCGARLCKKMDELRADQQRQHKETQAAQAEHLRRHDDITEFMGSMRRFVHEMDNRPLPQQSPQQGG